ncbi:MAG: hypothetical protein AUK35_08600 [Zetaproteobacteria bacterium CG2_30_46_52]|nr:MAG: hypothetical protein AUK35_08600 [Zetaproteobacteria bacterium CG2_30_46_52]
MIRLHLHGCKEGLQALQAMADEACEGVCLDEIQHNRLILVVDELFANIHEHGYNNAGGDIECEAQWLPCAEDMHCRLEIMLRDFAPPIQDVSKCKGVNPETLKDNPVAGGLGMLLIEAATETFEHTPLADGNQWRLVFLFKQKEVQA